MIKINFLIALAFVFILFSCNTDGSSPKEIVLQNKKADSISIQLNSPELKAVNAELVNDPNNPDLYQKRAKVYLALKQVEEAINDSKLAIRLDTTQVQYYNTLVDAYFAQNNTRLAKELLLIIEKKFPENTEALLKLGELYYLVRQYQNAINYVNKTLKIDESIARAYYMKGSIYRESGDTALAISSLETAIEQDNRYEDAFYDLGVIYAARKNALGLDYYNSALKINPDNSNTRYARAKLYQDLGKTNEAIFEYKAIASEYKTCDQCYYNLGAIYLEIKKDNAQALENFTKAITINPAYVEAYFARGFTYFKMKNKESAKADYNMCLKLQPNYEAAIDGLNNLK